mmetsp:Transcript_16530/g.37229  ORF Transcript_16530/g.37229 Transcript_16530/m.37229 type:complete len:313 (-) Transcript_16530:297-1235(-)
MQYPTAESIDCPGLLARMHPRVEALVVVEAHCVGLGDAVMLGAARGNDGLLNVGHWAALLASDANAGVLELVELDLALAAILDFIEDNVDIGRCALPVQEPCIRAELVELPAVEVLIALAEGVEGLLDVVPGQLILIVVIEPVGGRQPLPPASLRGIGAEGGAVVVVGSVSTCVQRLVIMEAHAVCLRRCLLHADFLPLRDGCLHQGRRAALLLRDASHAVLELLKLEGVLASGLVLCEEEAGVGPLVLPVPELAIVAELREVAILKLLVATSVGLEDLLDGVPHAVVLLCGVHCACCGKPCAAALAGSSLL